MEVNAQSLTDKLYRLGGDDDAWIAAAVRVLEAGGQTARATFFHAPDDRAVAFIAKLEKLQGATTTVAGGSGGGGTVPSTSTAMVGGAAGGEKDAGRGGIARFESILKTMGATVDPKILDIILRHFSAQVAVADTPQAVSRVYEMALRLPLTETRCQIRHKLDLVVNGTMSVNVISRSTFLYVFGAKDLKPYVMKVPIENGHARLEAEAWQAIAPPAGEEKSFHLAGPLTLLSLEGTLQEKTLKDGLVLPVFPATLEHVPPPLDPTAALKILRQMCVALGRIHGRGYCHNDVKPANIFMDNSGDSYLADFGSVRRLGDGADERTSRFLPVDVPEPMDTAVSSVAVDNLLLAVTLLERSGHLTLGRQALTYADVVAAKEMVVGELRVGIDELLGS